ncbi:MAG TPA: LLM class flavin-dependent oxidoreductase [Chloroflexota bacterium]
MKYGFVIPGGDVTVLVEIAQEVEEAGWDAVFVADGVYGTDPWISLAAIAVRTERVRIGTLLTPPSRRRPWKLASETATLDRLSNGRVILSTGLGATNTGFDKVGEETDRTVRAELFDEGLELVTRFWSGHPFTYSGRHYHVNWDVPWSYEPVQSPRITIWVVGAWNRPRSMARALRYDGILPVALGEEGSFSPITPSTVREIRTYVDEHRDTGGTFDIVIEGVTPADNREKARSILCSFEDAGATWWIESMWDVPGGLEAARARARQGPLITNGG